VERGRGREGPSFARIAAKPLRQAGVPTPWQPRREVDLNLRRVAPGQLGAAKVVAPTCSSVPGACFSASPLVAAPCSDRKVHGAVSKLPWPFASAFTCSVGPLRSLFLAVLRDGPFRAADWLAPKLSLPPVWRARHHISLSQLLTRVATLGSVAGVTLGMYALAPRAGLGIIVFVGLVGVLAAAASAVAKVRALGHDALWYRRWRRGSSIMVAATQALTWLSEQRTGRGATRLLLDIRLEQRMLVDEDVLAVLADLARATKMMSATLDRTRQVRWVSRGFEVWFRREAVGGHRGLRRWGRAIDDEVAKLREWATYISAQGRIAQSTLWGAKWSRPRARPELGSCRADAGRGGWLTAADAV